MATRRAETVHQVVAEHHCRQECGPIAGRKKAPPGVAVVSALRLPAIIREPVWVKLGDRFFHLKREGLYRFWDWGKVRVPADGSAPVWLQAPRRHVNVIVFRRDILALLGAVATLQHHGHRHIPLSFAEQLRHLRRGALSLTCGPSSQFVRELLGRFGWETRPVSCVRLAGAWTGWNDGHILNEMYWPRLRKWVLVDVNAHRMFVRNGVFLNAGEVRDLVERGEAFDFHWLTPRGLPLVDITPEVLGEFPMSSCGLAGWHDDDAMRQSLGELLRMPLLPHEGHFWFWSDDAAQIERICRYRPDARPLPRRDWLARFYGGR
jgi:hypothetical protein